MANSVLGNPSMINVIHDPRYPDKLKLLAEDFDRKGIPYCVWPAVFDEPTIEGSINMSHKQIVGYAKQASLEMITIAEDDAWFPADGGYEYYMRNMPMFFDIYLAGTYGPRKPYSRQDMPLAKFNLIEAEQIIGLHCYTIHESYYDTFLDTPDEAHIDISQRGGLFLACYPFACLQRPGYSSNNKRDVNYNTLLKPEDIYNGISKETRHPI